MEKEKPRQGRQTESTFFFLYSKGQFGLGFYSTFLIASSVRVSSLPPPSALNPHPKQHVFESDADGTSFKVYEDPRGNTLVERGTEIVMILREGEGEWLQEKNIRDLVYVSLSPSSFIKITIGLMSNHSDGQRDPLELRYFLPYLSPDHPNDHPAHRVEPCFRVRQRRTVSGRHPFVR